MFWLTGNIYGHSTVELRSKKRHPDLNGVGKKRKNEESERNFPELVWIFSLEVGNRVGK